MFLGNQNIGNCEAQPSFWMSYLVKSTRYAVKLKLGVVLSTTVLISERISFFCFSQSKESWVNKYDKENLKLHRQLLIILVEDVTRMLRDAASLQENLGGNQRGQDGQFRSGVMDFSPRDNFVVGVGVGGGEKSSKLRIEWIDDLDFLERNLEMVKVNLNLN